jgi:hypothetical protein
VFVLLFGSCTGLLKSCLWAGRLLGGGVRSLVAHATKLTLPEHREYLPSRVTLRSQVKQQNSEFLALRKHSNLTLKWLRFGGGNKSFHPGDAKCHRSQFIVERKYFASEFISLASLPNSARARKGASFLRIWRNKRLVYHACKFATTFPTLAYVFFLQRLQLQRTTLANFCSEQKFLCLARLAEISLWICHFVVEKWEPHYTLSICSNS